jgi:flavin reductase
MSETDLFKRGMRRLAAGVSVITTLDNGVPQGFVATAVTSVCADPTPSLLICVNRSASCHSAIRASGIFCVNLLGEGDEEIARVFSSPEHRHRRFDDCAWEALKTGAPALAGALVSFDCEVAEAIEVQSHTVFLGRVVTSHLWERAVEPLLYVDGHFDALRSTAPAGARAGLGA